MSPVDAGGVQDRAEAWGVHLGGEEEGETLHGSPQRAPDVQDLHEAAAAVAQVNARGPRGPRQCAVTLSLLASSEPSKELPKRHPRFSGPVLGLKPSGRPTDLLSFLSTVTP